jgi:hypothetical protein
VDDRGSSSGGCARVRELELLHELALALRPSMPRKPRPSPASLACVGVVPLGAVQDELAPDRVRVSERGHAGGNSRRVGDGSLLIAERERELARSRMPRSVRACARRQGGDALMLTGWILGGHHCRFGAGRVPGSLQVLGFGTGAKSR